MKQKVLLVWTVVFWVLCLSAVPWTMVPSALAGTINYTYDDAGRLIKADYGNDKTIAYTYDNAGNLLNQKTNATDKTPPTVVSTDPADEAADVSVSAAIHATFSEAMMPLTINTRTFKLSGGVTGKVTYDKTTYTATLTPSASLKYSTRYTVTITPGVKDLARNAMASSYTGEFTTAAECKAKSIVANPTELTLKMKQSGDTVVTVTGDNGCLVEGIMVKATIVSGNNSISVLPDSKKTNADGKATFTMKAKNRVGTAKVEFKATGLLPSVIVTVNVQS